MEKIGKNKDSRIEINLNGNSVLERTAGKFGTGAHVIVPSEFIGKKVKIIFSIEDYENEKGGRK